MTVDKNKVTKESLTWKLLMNQFQQVNLSKPPSVLPTKHNVFRPEEEIQNTTSQLIAINKKVSTCDDHHDFLCLDWCIT